MSTVGQYDSTCSINTLSHSIIFWIDGWFSSSVPREPIPQRILTLVPNVNLGVYYVYDTCQS